jgi:hypothetical protein
LIDGWQEGPLSLRSDAELGDHRVEHAEARLTALAHRRLATRYTPAGAAANVTCSLRGAGEAQPRSASSSPPSLERSFAK